MFLRSISAFFALALAPVLAGAAAKTPPAPILKLANAVIHAANTDDASALGGLYTGDATVVDENPPFVWRGAGAGVAWWRVVDATVGQMKMTNMKAVNVRISDFVQSSTDAYMVQPLTVTGVIGAKPFAESGTMTYTFHKTGDAWLISSQVWTTKP